MGRDIQRNAGLWDDIADKIEGVSMAAADAAEKLLTCGLQLGFLLLEFAERPEIQAEIKLVTERGKGKGRGRKFTLYGYVARKLAKQYEYRLPGSKWMTKCARAALMARERNLSATGVETIIGWRNFIEDGTRPIKIVEPPDPARMLGLKAEHSHSRSRSKPAAGARTETGTAGKKPAPENFEDSVVDAVSGMVLHAERLVESCESAAGWNYPGQFELVKSHLSRLDRKLNRIGYQVTYVVSGI